MAQQQPVDPDQIYQSYGKDLYRLTGEEGEDSIIDILNADLGANNSSNVQTSASDLGGGVSNATTTQASGAATSQGKTTYDNTVTGYILGVDPASGIAKFYIGNSTSYLNWDGTNLTIVGNINVSSINIPDATTASSFHVDSAGDTWWGVNVASGLANAPASVTAAGVAVFKSISLSGSVSISGIANNTSTDISLLSNTQNMVFTSASATQINWTSGTIVLSNGRSFSISSGNTGTMSALTYIYLDTGVSSTVLQTTSTYSTAMGANKLLVGTAQNNSVGASFIPFGGGQPILDGTAQIAALSITAPSIASAAVTGAKIAAATIAAANIINNTITATQIANATITTTQIAAAAAITGAQIASATIGAANIVANTITASQIAANTITASQIAANTITAGQIAANTITAGQILAGTITATQIAAATILASNLVSGTITATQIAAGTITTTQIAANTILAGNIAAATITSTQIAATTITASNIAAGTITGTQIAASTITASLISVSTLSAISANLGTITAGSITINSGAASIDSSGNAIFKSIQIGGGTTQYTITNTGMFSYGDGSDGAVTWDGTTTILGMAPVSTVYTLTRDIYISTGTINNGVTIKAGGYRIFASTSLTVNGIIDRSGSNGQNGSVTGSLNAGGGPGGAAVPDGYLKGSTAGGNGGGVGDAANLASNITNSIGVSGVPTGGVATPSNVKLIANWHLATLLDVSSTGSTVKFTSSGSSDGGAGTGTGSGSGGGGGGASAGGIIAIYARILTIGATGAIKSNGGTGGNGASSVLTGQAGGGGSGGVVVLVYNQLTNSGSIAATAGLAGTGGANSNGNPGVIYEFQISL